MNEKSVTPRGLLIELIGEVRKTREELLGALAATEARLTEQMRGLAKSVGRDVGDALSRLNSAELRLGTLAEDQITERRRASAERAARIR